MVMSVPKSYALYHTKILINLIDIELYYLILISPYLVLSVLFFTKGEKSSSNVVVMILFIL